MKLATQVETERSAKFGAAQGTQQGALQAHQGTPLAITPAGPGAPAPGCPGPANRRAGGPRCREAVAGYVFLSPWLLRLMGVTAPPMLRATVVVRHRFGVRTCRHSRAVLI
jgi:hypothetical protein